MSKPAYLAFETGGTKLVAGVAGPDLRLLETRTIYREPGAEARHSLGRLIELGHELQQAHEAIGLEFRGCGLGFGGYVRRSDRRPLANLHEPGWGELDVVKLLHAAFNIPATIENDCKLAALAEAHFGAGRGQQTVFYMTLGTGVGGGIVRDGSIIEMSDIGEAEIGHIIVLPNGPLCACGNRGCVEAVCSGPGLSGLAEWVAENKPQLRAATKLRRSETGFASEDLMTAWRTGDPFARKVIETAAICLASAVAVTINLLAPSVFVIGGGVGSGNPEFVGLVREKAIRLVAPCFRDRYEIRSSLLGAQVVTQGAAILASQQAEPDWRPRDA
ncbi:MAG: ROK family protein [Acidobacteria bacterium]|nr:ROK family protein [Acidobacteriota bacterium]